MARWSCTWDITISMTSDTTATIFSNACSTRCWRSIQHSLQHLARHHPFLNLGTGASNDASCVSWDAFLKMRWIFATKSAEASCERRLLMELQALGPATIQDEKSTLQKTVVFCLVSFFFFFFFYFFGCCWMLVVQYHWLRHSVDGSLAPFWQLWSLSRLADAPAAIFNRQWQGHCGGMKFIFGNQMYLGRNSICFMFPVPNAHVRCPCFILQGISW